MTDITPILSGARFRTRDCFPSGLRFLTMHLTPWRDGCRTLRCSNTNNGTPAAVYRDRAGWYRWTGRLNAGHATIEGGFAPSMDVLASDPYDTEAEAMAAADAAILAWFADRIEDGSVVYPWPAVPVGPSIFGSNQ